MSSALRYDIDCAVATVGEHELANLQKAAWAKHPQAPGKFVGTGDPAISPSGRPVLSWGDKMREWDPEDFVTPSEEDIDESIDSFARESRGSAFFGESIVQVATQL